MSGIEPEPPEYPYGSPDEDWDDDEDFDETEVS